MKVVIDCDVGTDDAQAIILALADKNVDLVAITAVFGNAELKNTAENALRLLQFCNRSNIPVYRGSHTSLLGHECKADGFHGRDGMGDVRKYSTNRQCKEQHAVNALLELSHVHKDELTIVALGPLTNLSLAIRLDPDFGKRLSACYVMGGNMHGQGNITPCAEFNFYSDPHAAKIVLNELGCAVFLIALELCATNYPSWEWYKELTSKGTKLSQFIKDIDGVTVKITQETSDKYCAWDQLAVACLLQKDLVMETKTVYATVETTGEHTLGQTIVDWNNKWNKKPNITLITKVDTEKYHDLMMRTFSATESI